MITVKRIKAAFPDLPMSFYEILVDRLKEKGFSDQRFAQAANQVIDNCMYPRPTVGEFISFDRRVELLNYVQMLKKLDEAGPIIWEIYKSISIDGNKFWVHKKDFELMNL